MIYVCIYVYIPLGWHRILASLLNICYTYMYFIFYLFSLHIHITYYLYTHIHIFCIYILHIHITVRIITLHVTCYMLHVTYNILQYVSLYIQ